MKSALLILLLNSLSLTIIAQDLIADYRFNGNAADSSGNGFHATVYGATLTTDRFGNENSAYFFNGISDYIDTHSIFDFQERSVLVWFLVDDTTMERQVIDQDSEALNFGSYGLSVQNGILYGNAGGESGAVVSESPELNKWYHVALIRCNAHTQIYLNGDLVYSGFSSSKGSSYYPNPELVIGTYRNKSSQFFSGKIDEVQIYNYCLDLFEIQTIYSSDISDPEYEVKLYPNPMDTHSILEFNNQNNNSHTFTLTDVKGSRIRTINDIKNNYVDVYRSTLASGVYYYQLENNIEIVARGKLVVR